MDAAEKRYHQMARIRAESPDISLADMAKELDLSISYISKLHRQEEYKEIERKNIEKETRSLCNKTLNVAYQCIQKRIIDNDDHKTALKFIEIINDADGGGLVNFNVDNREQKLYIPVYGKNDPLNDKE